MEVKLIFLERDIKKLNLKRINIFYNKKKSF